MGTIFMMILVYAIGFAISMAVLINYGEQLGFGDYDPPHDDYYDDYSSNASAWVSFSTMWPVFWFINGLVYFHRVIVDTTQNLIKCEKR